MTVPAAQDHVDAVAVVIPARNEEALVSRALHAVRRAAREAQAQLGVRAPQIELVLVADDCVDATVALAREVLGVRVHEIQSATVGAARAAGVELALESLLVTRSIPVERVWIANTDADSVVPPHWILDQIEIASRGVDVMVGTVRPDFDDLTADQVAHWLATHTPGQPNGHVHGANLGVRANVYLAAGGFHGQPEHEDVDLVARVRQHGARLLAADSCEVFTSGRQIGRTPGGYAQFLRTAVSDGAGAA
ncbi:glycosyl transferase family 2 [Glaciihabitans tibetensis]|uniref:4,4'-diaponeurosporenoate glycosyltransferase n=1 Tax=Glaciihabitans tibetensis TaxID=1266600 RepID=A0A2T0VFK6_9MICO|nr:glycosyltransferase [Glaciihabitans tibetensis]PRY68990.1 glycosyl transferase family 2 [Glaciihabitans tibetensis]